jgi:hypothetical protein
VGQMPKIYSSSLRTVIWLGETEPDAPTCIVRANGYCAIEGFSSVEHGNMLQLLDHFLEDAEKASLKPEARYLMRVCWKRLWCIQEFMLSPRVPKVMAGPHLVRWHDFLVLTDHVISPLFKSSPNSLNHSSSIKSLSSDHDSNHWQSPSRKRNLFELLRITSKDFACSDPKDRIFALIGISNDSDVSIQVDYARTTEEVYTEATKYFINTEGTVDILLDERASRLNDSLPTWIPEFATIKTIKEVGTPDASRASSEKPVAEVIYWEPSIPCGCTGSCLKLRAIKLDKIVRRVAVVAHYMWSPLATSAATLYRTHGLNLSVINGNMLAFEAISCGGGNSKDIECFVRSHLTEIKRKRKVERGYSSQTSRDPDHKYTGQSLYEEYSFVDCILEALAIDLAQPPLLKLERLPQIGLLFLDYLFHGTQSLGKVMKYFHEPNFTRCRHWIGDWRLAQAQLVQRHRLPERQAFSHDLEVALEIQPRVLSRIAKSTGCMRCENEEHEPPESTCCSKSGYERVFFKTEDQHLGVGPGDLQIDDEVVVPFGSSKPWVLRSHGDHHVLVGEAFVPGIMTGQLEELWRRGDLEYMDYVLR